MGFRYLFLRTVTAAVGALLGLAAVAPGALAAGTPPAGGAAIGQVIAATLGAMVATGAMLALVWGHRTGRTQLLARLARVSEKATGDAGWSSLGGAFLGGALLIAVFGMYWDISIHIDKGRDPGPLANPAHYFILVGLFGVLFAGGDVDHARDEEAGRRCQAATQRLVGAARGW